MLDPSTAIGLASSIAQLIEFSAKLLEAARDIKSNGASVNVSHLKKITIDLVSLSELLKQTPRPYGLDDNVLLNREQETLSALADNCTKVGDELVAVLEKLTFNNDSGNWKSIRAALMTVMKKSKINRLAEQLDGYRQELILRTLTLSSARNDAYSSKLAECLDTIGKGGKDVVEIVSITQGMVKTASDSQSRFQETTRTQYNEIIAAILTMRDGTIDTIAPTHPEISRDRTVTDTESDNIQTCTTFRETSSYKTVGESAARSALQVDNYSLVPTVVLECLSFRHITDRIEEIAEAHQATFGWVYDTSATDVKLWNSLIDWLERGSGCYWINGKAGSGKSTLVKHICHNPATHRALSTWAGNDTLEIASFFFWNLGSTLQKSQEGLLRSLLHDVLDRHRYLIPRVFPGLCRAAVTKKNQPLSPPSFMELRKAFSDLMRHASSMKICFFIDGVDEYHGNHSQILDLLAALASSSNVKLLISSRPLNSCIDAFSRHPTLRLQDLTHDDIRGYVEVNLGGHANMKRLIDREGSAASKLLDEIADKASGVFLWVKLAVTSLIEGLQNYDCISDLRRRLEQLPADLEQLYQHMLHTMSPLYQEQASQFFQLVLRSTEVQADDPLTLLQLSYAEDDLMDVFHKESQILEMPELLARCEATEGRLRSRCCGLVEVLHGGRRKWKPHQFSPRVGFLHRTVAEFLRIDKVWSDIVSLTDTTSFDCNISLLSSAISQAKVTCMNDYRGLRSSFAYSCLTYARLAEDTSLIPQSALLEEFDLVMQSPYNELDIDQAVGTQWTNEFARKPTFLLLAVRFGLVLYVNAKVRENSDAVTSGEAGDLLHEAVGTFLTGVDNIPRKNFAEIISCLLRIGTDPGSPSSSKGRGVPTEDFTSPWQMLLDAAVALAKNKHDFCINFGVEGHSKLFTDVVQQFVVFGADVNSKWVLKSGEKMPPSEIVQELFTLPAQLRNRLCRRAPGNLDLYEKAWETMRSLLTKRGATLRESSEEESEYGITSDEAWTTIPRSSIAHHPRVPIGLTAHRGYQDSEVEKRLRSWCRRASHSEYDSNPDSDSDSDSNFGMRKRKRNDTLYSKLPGKKRIVRVRPCT